MVLLNDDKEEKELSEVREREEEELMQTLSAKYGIPYINLVTVPIETDALRLVPEADARAAKIGPFAIANKKAALAVFSPHVPEVRAIVDRLTAAGWTVELHMASTKSLAKVYDHYKELSSATLTHAGTVELGASSLSEAAASIKTLAKVGPKIKEIIDSKQQNRISRLIEMTIGAAIAIGASDIHVEPEEGYVTLRYRLDGMLQEVIRFDRGTYALINSRIKLLSGLKLNVRESAQDGRITVALADKNIEIRTSLLPGAYGESIVLRILDPKSIQVPLESLGMHPKLLSVIEHEISKPNGMLLTTGPTGSGKTTTLYAFLRKIHTPDVKIITIEDPIEYHLAGITQTQVEAAKKYTFASGLRAALRQDPDVIMVGEIRDEETAEIAINSALTGHLVFSTLHTNNAAGTFPRLIDLGVNPKTITSAINLAMAQRLVRKLCENCKTEAPIPEKDKSRIFAVVATLPEGIEKPQTERYWRPKGCDRCNTIGYKGRIGVYEAIKADSSIEKIVRENPSEREISAAAASQGIPNMAQDGILKVLSGVTTLEELERVVELEAK